MVNRASLTVTVVLAIAVGGGPVTAQTPGTLTPKPLPPLATPNAPNVPAKELFGRATTSAPWPARSIGAYAKGCVAGAVALPVNGETWQVMRLSRNRNWGHPDLIAALERFAREVPKASSWRGVLVGDMSQPRGGPMLTGHASHQIGLDADIWLTPMPARTLSKAEREQMSAVDMVRRDKLDIDPATWTADHVAVIRAAALLPEVERVLVNPAIKKALCREAPPPRAWLQKVRPYWGHNYHMHVRIGCPRGNADCAPQDPVPAGEGCGKELDWWFSDAVLHPKPDPNYKPKPPLTLADLPSVCRQVLLAK